MQIITEKSSIPLSLYIHIPWCVKKCPYCDFNSYAVTQDSSLPVDAYIRMLKKDLEEDLSFVFDRPLQSIFFGGGTPSLFPPHAFENILNAIQKHIIFAPDIEITMEANPGTLEHTSFKDYKAAGINRISLGAQSFQDEKLKALGRIHQSHELISAFKSLEEAHFENFNIDLMYGLPNQSVQDALYDLQQAISFNPKHISWYHLTLEPNTYFHKFPPPLPMEEVTFDIQNEGLAFLATSSFQQYEVSAFAKSGYPSRHNLNYWTFGDYLGIGAGAHGKVTDPFSKKIIRYAKTKTPTCYLNLVGSKVAELKSLTEDVLPFEFMLNALRLMEPIPFSLFEERCFLPRSALLEALNKGEEQGLLSVSPEHILITDLGNRFLNNVMALFL